MALEIAVVVRSAQLSWVVRGFRLPGVPIPIAAAVVAVAAHAGAQPQVRIRAETRLELRTDVGGSRMTVRGHLRDDVGEPLGDQPVVIRIDPASGAEGLAPRTVRTNARGEFSLELPRREGMERVSAEFPGDAGHDPTDARRPIDPSRSEVRLQIQVPNGERLDLAAREHEITVWAASPAGGEGLRVELRDELERLLAADTTDSAGRARFVVPSQMLGAAGAGRLEARTPGDAAREPARTEVPIVRARQSRLALETRTEDGGVVLQGSLQDAAGPLPDRAVGLFTEDGGHLATLLTDERGAFRHRLGWDALAVEPQVVHARFDSDATGRTSSTSAPVTVPARPEAGPAWPWLLVPMAATALLVLLTFRRRPVPSARPPHPTGARPAGVDVARGSQRAATRWDLGGHVRDNRDGRAVPDAMVTLIPATQDAPRSVPVDTTGAFHADDLPPGRGSLRVEAEGYAPLETTFEVPHRGEWSNTVARMDSYRTLALRPFRAVAERWLPSLPQWGTSTNREVSDRARARGAGPGFERLTESVEQVYYGAVPPTRDDLQTVERRAREATAEVPSQEGDGGVVHRR